MSLYLQPLLILVQKPVVTTICLMQWHTSPSDRVDQVVDCGLEHTISVKCQF